MLSSLETEYNFMMSVLFCYRLWSLSLKTGCLCCYVLFVTGSSFRKRERSPFIAHLTFIIFIFHFTCEEHFVVEFYVQSSTCNKTDLFKNVFAE